MVTLYVSVLASAWQLLLRLSPQTTRSFIGKLVCLAIVWLLGIQAGHAQIFYILNDGQQTGRADQLRRANANGTGDVVLNSSFADNPGSIAVDRPRNRLFIGERRTLAEPKIYTVDVTTGASTTFLTAPTPNSFVGGMTVDPVNNYLYYILEDASSTTRNDQLRRINLDGTGDVLILTNFANQTEAEQGAATFRQGPLVLDAANNRLLVPENRPAAGLKILSVSLSTSAVTTFVTTASQVAGMALDAPNNKLYYTLTDGLFSTQVDQLRRINLDGTGDELVATNYLFVGATIALDAANNRILSSDGRSNTTTGYNNIYGIDRTTKAVNFTLSASSPPANFVMSQIAFVPTCASFPVTLTPSPGSVLNCANPSLTLTATGGVGYAFARVGGGAGLVSQNTLAGTAVVNASGTYSVTVTNADGCTATTTTTITGDTSPPTASIGSAVNELNCITSAITLTATGGGTYLWDNGTTNATRNVNVANTYSVTVTGANGCTAVATKTITSNTTPAVVSLTATDVCAGQSVTLTATPGLVDYTFTTPSGTVNTALNNIRVVPGLAAGPYNFTVAARHPTSFCQATATAGATVSPAPTPTLTASRNAGPPSTTLTCAQTSLTLTATGGTSYTFVRVGGGAGLVSSDPVAGTAVVNASGTYSVTVGNATGCISTTTITISSDQTAPTVSINPTSGTLTCAITSLTLTANTSGTGVIWNTNATSNSIVVTTSGTYGVTATGANGCTATTSVTIDQNTTTPNATLSASNSGTLTCAVTSLTLTAGNVPGGSYAFTGPSGTLAGSGNTRTVSEPGTYTVLVTGANGCTATATTTVFSNTTTPTVTLTPLTSGTLTCARTSLTLVATGGGTYSFAGPGGGPSGVINQTVISGVGVAYINLAGTYSVTVTNATTGCFSTTTTEVFSNTTAPALTLSATNSGTLTCAVTSLTITASPFDPNTSYRFAGPSITAFSPSHGWARVDASGVYSVTALYVSTGCFSVTTITIYQNVDLPTPTLAASGTLTCSVTSLTLTAGGGTSYAFAGPGVVSQNATAGTAVVNQSGTYSVTVTNTATGCFSITTTTVLSNTTAPTPTLTPSPSGTLTCQQTSLTLTAGGGTSYAFSGPGVVSQNAASGTAVINAPGTYSVTVTGSNGCTATASTVISQSANLPTPTLAASGTLTCAITSVTLTATGSNSYAFSGLGVVSQNTTAGTAVVNQSGTYSVTVTNTTTGCFSITTTTVESNTTAPTVNVSPTSSTLTCSVTSLTLTASGTGTSYRWTGGAGLPGSTGNTLVVTTSGTYAVTATGANGCTAVSSGVVIDQNITAPGNPQLSASNSGTLTCAVPSLTLTALATGTGLTYAFAGPSGALAGSGNIRVVGAPGTYTVTITGANGCTATATTTVSSNTTAPTATLTPSPSGTLTCAQTSLTLTATGGSPYTFSGPGIVSQNAASGTAVINAPGTYSVTVTGANGCTASIGTVISQSVTLPTATLTASPSGTLTCSQTSLTLTATGGNSYAFAGPSGTLAGSGNTRTINASGTYSVTVTNTATGCFSVTTTTVVSNTTVPMATLMASRTAICTPGSVTLTAGTGMSYAFSGPGLSQSGTSATAVVSQGGTFSVVVTGSNGCTASAGVIISSSPTPAAPALSGASLTYITSNTPLSLTTLVTATPPNTLTFLGSNGLVNPPVANISSPGVQTFSAIQTNAAGCVSPATVFSVTALSPLPPSSQSTCRGSSVVLNVLPTGVSYQWFRHASMTAPGARLTNVASLYRGTTTASLTLVSIQTTGYYSCQVTQANGTVQTFGPFAVVVTLCSAREVAADIEAPLQVRIAPNPLENNRLEAAIDGATGQPLTVRLLSVTGTIVREEQWKTAAQKQSISWDMSEQPAGLYLLHVISNGQRVSVKVVKP